MELKMHWTLEGIRCKPLIWESDNNELSVHINEHVLHLLMQISRKLNSENVLNSRSSTYSQRRACKPSSWNGSQQWCSL